MGKQLGLFSNEEKARFTEEEAEIAATLPRFVRFGTSSWTFPKWPMWPAAPSLRTYTTHPLLCTAGIDRSFYGPLLDHEAESYASEIPSDFRFTTKVWEEITTFSFPSHPRYGARAGQRNPHFLDVNRFLEQVLPPYRHLPGTVFVFELTPMPAGAMTEKELVASVDAFASKLPAGSWSFELRNQEYLGPRWFDMLRAHRAAHVFTYWTAMPSLGHQLKMGGLGHADHVVVRLMLPPYTRYEMKKAEYAPFDKIVERKPEMRADVLDILRAAAAADTQDVFVIVNNKAEGSAPQTIRELAAEAARQLC